MKSDKENPFEMAGMDRREFLRLMGASLALAGLGACTKQPPEAIVPYINQPAEIVPGKPLFYTTAFELGGAAYGILAESHMGRPTKIEGNPKHPGSLGGTDVFGQAAILSLYDPDRAQTVLQYGKVSSWEAYYFVMLQELQSRRGNGAGLRILTPGFTSPTLARLMGEFLRRYPQARWHRYDPVNIGNARAGAREAFGIDVQPVYSFDKADVILALDSDFLMWEPGRLRYARDFIDRRRVREGGGTGVSPVIQTTGETPVPLNMNRLYAIEGTPSLTGAMADHRLAVKPSRVEAFARAILKSLGATALIGIPTKSEPPDLSKDESRWIAAAAADLVRARGRGLVLAGQGQPPAVHALAIAINSALGNIGQTVSYIDPLEAGPADSAGSLKELTADMLAGRVQVLIVMGGNPAYDAPADSEFVRAMSAEKSPGVPLVPLRIRHGLYVDETSNLCHWHLPETHFLETWGDALGHDGTASIIQPLIQPIYTGRPAIAIAAMLLEQPDPAPLALVRETWQAALAGRDFERAWQDALLQGFISGTAHKPRAVALRSPDVRAEARTPNNELELIFRPDYAVWDGRFANNSWLQELPQPFTKTCWDNPLLLGPATARRLGVANEDVVELTWRDQHLKAPVWIAEGHAEDCVTAYLGYGRTASGGVGTGVGFNALALRGGDAAWFGGGLKLRRTGATRRVAAAHDRASQEGRPVALRGEISDFRGNPRLFADATELHQAQDSVYPPYEYKDYKWGMMIDLGACIGCNACVAACQAENNIPTVGRDQVLRGREMHWLRVDRYTSGGPEKGRAIFQPLPCMHCELAPCELVCPVGATVHGNEGLNEMVYNRCVGTRYCSNNCPYKVRHFNFYKFGDMSTMVLKMGRNPDVTVRTRGVMEKCTYCVQRIVEARITAQNENRRIKDGEVQTACQQACPTRAIIFGDLNDPNSAVVAAARQPQGYTLMAQLNTRPRTKYLARLDNPNTGML